MTPVMLIFLYKQLESVAYFFKESVYPVLIFSTCFEQVINF